MTAEILGTFKGRAVKPEDCGVIEAMLPQSLEEIKAGLNYRYLPFY